MVEHVVALRRVATAVSDPAERRRLERVIRDLRRRIGIGVPKRRAAAVLGVTVQALERWIHRGLLPVARKPGSSRELVDTDALLALAGEVAELREAGRTRGLLAAAFRELEHSGHLPRKLRPNESARELRAAYLRTTPGQRLRDVADLSRTVDVLAAAGRRHRRRSE